MRAVRAVCAETTVPVAESFFVATVGREWIHNNKQDTGRVTQMGPSPSYSRKPHPRPRGFKRARKHPNQQIKSNSLSRINFLCPPCVSF